MFHIKRSSLVAYSSQQMYRLVNDVDKYSHFLPGCTGSRILCGNDSQIIAAVDISQAGIKNTFITSNTLINNKSINMKLIEGPFRYLDGKWQFTTLSNKVCKIDLNLDFEFTNFFVELAFGHIFKEIANSLIQAFNQRAKEVYNSEYDHGIGGLRTTK